MDFAQGSEDDRQLLHHAQGQPKIIFRDKHLEDAYQDASLELK